MPIYPAIFRWTMLSERFYISKFYLSHQFKQYTQLSLHQYILSRRMMHAQILLRSGHAPRTWPRPRLSRIFQLL